LFLQRKLEATFPISKNIGIKNSDCIRTFKLSFPFHSIKNILKHKSENEELRKWRNTNQKDVTIIFKMK